jgi:hypothetical protein
VLNEAPAKPQLLKLGITVIVFLVIVFYLLIAGTRGDLLWFQPGIEGRPVQLTIYRYGVSTTIHPHDRGFDDIVSVAQQEIPKIDALPMGGPGPDTISHVKNNDFALELDYGKEITIHSSFALGNPDTILIPFDGWEGQHYYFYLAANGVYGAWLPVLRPDSQARIRAAVTAANY